MLKEDVKLQEATDLPFDKENIEKNRKLPQLRLVSALGLLALSGLFAVLVAVPALNERQSTSSEATASQAWFTFVPASVGANATKKGNTNLVLRKTTGGNISAVQVKLTYNNTKVSNFQVNFDKWVVGKNGLVLQPVQTTTSGTTNTVTFALGSPCEENKCFNIKKGTTKIASISLNASGASTVQLHTDTIVTMISDDGNTYLHSSSQPLTVNLVQ